MRWFRLCFIAGFCSVPLLGQCIGIGSNPIFVSDRYVSVVAWDQWVGFSNEYGITFRDTNSGPLSVSHLEPIPGHFGRVISSGNAIYALVPGSGFFVFEMSDGSPIPSNRSFKSFPGIKDFAIEGSSLYVVQNESLALYDLSLLSETPLAEVPISFTVQKLVSFPNGLVIHTSDAKAFSIPKIDQTLGAMTALEVAGETEFYSVYRLGELLVFDARPGVIAASWNNTGTVGNPFNLIQNQGIQIVLGLATSQNKLFVRYTGQIIGYNWNGTNLQEMGRYDVDLSEIRFPLMEAQADQLFLLNGNFRPGEWSVIQLNPGTGGFERTTLQGTYSGFNGFTMVDNTFFLSTGDQIQYGPLLNGLPNLEMAASINLEEDVLEIVSQENQMFASLANPLGQDSLLVGYDVSQNPPQRNFEQRFVGSIDQVDIKNGILTFVQFFRDEVSDRYVIHAVDMESLEFITQFELILDVGATPPIQGLIYTPEGLFFHNQTELFRVSNQQLEPMNLSGSVDQILAVAYLDGWMLIEAPEGIYTARRDRSQILFNGFYRDFFELITTHNGLVLVKNRNQSEAGHYWTLLREGNILAQHTRLTASLRPEFVGIDPDGILVSEGAALNRQQLSCKLSDCRYLFPFDERIGFEFSSAFDEDDWVRFNIFDSANRIVGTPILDSQVLASAQGEWLGNLFQNYNRFETPFRFTIDATFPVRPVFERRPFQGEPPRFALRMPKRRPGILVAPHVPNPQNNWFSELWVVGDSERVTLDLDFFGTQGVLGSLTLVTGYFEQVAISAEFGDDQRYVQIQPRRLADEAQGFVLYSRGGSTSPAAVPLSSEPSDIFFLPHTMYREDWWTGLALTNPHDFAVRMRFIGYDNQGEIIVDRSEDLPPRQRFLVLVEDWLKEELGEQQIEWAIMVCQAPLYSMSLAGQLGEDILGGYELPLSSSENLIFSGVGNSEIRWTELVIINRFTAAAECQVIGLDAKGEVIAESTLSLAKRQRWLGSLDNLFPGQDTQAIVTVKVQSDSELIGLLMRGSPAGDSFNIISVSD